MPSNRDPKITERALAEETKRQRNRRSGSTEFDDEARIAEEDPPPAPPTSLARDSNAELVNPNRKRRQIRNLSLATQIDALTRNGVQIVGYMSALMKGQVRGSTVKDRTEAAKWLAERKWGKTPDTVLHAHAHAIAEVPATLTNAVLTSIARGDKLKLEDIVDGAIVSEDASEEEIAGLLAAAEPDERDDGPGGSGPDSAGEAGPGDDTEEGDSDSVGEGGPELSAARDPGEDP